VTGINKARVRLCEARGEEDVGRVQKEKVYTYKDRSSPALKVNDVNYFIYLL
jgi:hypothetical protein